MPFIYMVIRGGGNKEPTPFVCPALFVPSVQHFRGCFMHFYLGRDLVLVNPESLHVSIRTEECLDGVPF